MREYNSVEELLKDLPIEKDIEAQIIRLVEKIRKKRNVKLCGECKMCGKCCSGDIYKIKKDTIVKLNEKRICPKYDRETKQCKAHNEERPSWCTMFPYLPENLYEGCGYNFEESK